MTHIMKEATATQGRDYPFYPLEEAVLFGMNVEYLRELQGLSKTKLCAVAGISRPTLYKIERGESNLKLSTMVRIAKALGVRFIDLFSVPYE